MILKLISPKIPIKSFWDLKVTAKLLRKNAVCANLWLPVIASVTPGDITVICIDENVEKINYNEKVDLVALSGMTCGIKRSFEIANIYRKKGVPVIIGGIHATMNPEECQNYADSVVVGEAEKIWPKIVKDFQEKKLKPLYTSDTFTQLTEIPVPRYDLLKIDKYMAAPVQTTRGCPFNCDFCSVKIINGPMYRKKTIEQIIRELKFIKKQPGFNSIMICDDNFIGDLVFAKKLLKAMIPLHMNWMAQCSVNLGDHPDILQLMKKSSGIFVFIGFETVNKDNLKAMNKFVNNPDEYQQKISAIHNAGISVVGSLILGSDNDDLTSFREAYEFLNENNIIFCMLNILTPLPGTKLFKRMEKEDRFLTLDWNYFNVGNITIKTRKLSSEELRSGFIWLHKKYYNYDEIYKRFRRLIRRGNWKRPIKNKATFQGFLVLLNLLRSYLFTTNLKQIRFLFKMLKHLPNKNVDGYFIGFILAYGKGFNDYIKQMPKIKNPERFENSEL